MARGKLASRVDFGAFGATLGSCAGVTGVPAVIVSLAVGDERRRCRGRVAAGPPTSGGRRCRRRRGTSPGPTGGGVAAGGGGWAPAVQGAVVIVSLPVGDECRRCRVPALPRPVVGVSPAAGDKPQPYIRLPPAAVPVQGAVVIVSLAVGDECRPAVHCFVGGWGSGPSHVRWSVFRRRRGTSPSPTLGRRRCRRRRGMSAGGAGFRPSQRPVVGVSPAAGDKPQPYIRTAALPGAPAGTGGWVPPAGWA